MSRQIPSAEPRLTADEYLGAAPDAFGDIEVADGLVVHDMAQSQEYDLVVRRLASALENARPADGPCYRVNSDAAVRFADAASSRADHRLNIRYPDITVATYRHHVKLRIQGTIGQIRARLPASIATIEEPSPGKRPSENESTRGTDLHASRWQRVEVRAERLDWLPPRARLTRSAVRHRAARRTPQPRHRLRRQAQGLRGDAMTRRPVGRRPRSIPAATVLRRPVTDAPVTQPAHPSRDRVQRNRHATSLPQSHAQIR